METRGTQEPECNLLDPLRRFCTSQNIGTRDFAGYFLSFFDNCITFFDGSRTFTEF